MVVAIHQLHYLPWLRYFDKIVRCDIFIILDNIQYTKGGYQNRNKIKTAEGWMYLTVPVRTKLGMRLDEVKINNQTRWRDIHWQALITNYSQAKYFKRYAHFFNEVYQKSWEYLNDLNFTLLDFFIKELGIKTKILRSSQLDIKGEATERLINICKAVGGNIYLSGAYAAEVYLDSEQFEEAGIKVIFQKWESPVYNQLFPRAGFIPDLSIIDLLFNEGEKSLGILLGEEKIG